MADFKIKNGLQVGKSLNEAVGTVTGNATLDLATGNSFALTPTDNVTFVFSNPPATGAAFNFSLKLTGALISGSPATFTYPASVKWPAGTPPTAPADGETDVLTFFTTDGGTTYYGIRTGDDMS
jgi:hypothetical protein